MKPEIAENSLTVGNWQKCFRWAYIPPLIHLWICFVGIVGTLVPRVNYLAFAWTFVFIADFPISIIPFVLVWKYPLTGALWLIVVGTLWWYLLTLGAERLVREVRGDRQ
jgi:hypothetical protein